MATLDQLVAGLGGTLFVACAWALSKVYERDAEDRKTARASLHHLRGKFQTLLFRVAIIERHLKIEPLSDEDLEET